MFKEACKQVMGKAEQTERILDGKLGMSMPVEA